MPKLVRTSPWVVCLRGAVLGFSLSGGEYEAISDHAKCLPELDIKISGKMDAYVGAESAVDNAHFLPEQKFFISFAVSSRQNTILVLFLSSNCVRVRCRAAIPEVGCRCIQAQAISFSNFIKHSFQKYLSKNSTRPRSARIDGLSLRFLSDGFLRAVRFVSVRFQLAPSPRSEDRPWWDWSAAWKPSAVVCDAGTPSNS